MTRSTSVLSRKSRWRARSPRAPGRCASSIRVPRRCERTLQDCAATRRRNEPMTADVDPFGKGGLLVRVADAARQVRPRFWTTRLRRASWSAVPAPRSPRPPQPTMPVADDRSRRPRAGAFDQFGPRGRRSVRVDNVGSGSSMSVLRKAESGGTIFSARIRVALSRTKLVRDGTEEHERRKKPGLVDPRESTYPVRRIGG